MDHDIHCLGLSCSEEGTVPIMSTSIGKMFFILFGEGVSECDVLNLQHFTGSFAGGVTDYGGFEFKPAELTPALCDDLYDNLVGKLILFKISKCYLSRDLLCNYCAKAH